MYRNQQEDEKRHVIKFEPVTPLTAEDFKRIKRLESSRRNIAKKVQAMVERNMAPSPLRQPIKIAGHR